MAETDWCAGWLATEERGRSVALVIEPTWDRALHAARELRDFCYDQLCITCEFNRAKGTLTHGDKKMVYLSAADPFLSKKLHGYFFDRIWGLSYLSPESAAEAKSRVVQHD